MIKAIIVEDEEALRTLIRKFVQEVDQEIVFIDECENIIEAEKSIIANSPDIIFLDVIMPRGTGLDLLAKLPSLNSEVIFITAYDKYILDAFQYAATGYVLKPIDKDKLKIAIGNAKKRLKQESASSLQGLLQYMERINSNKKIGVPTQDGVIFVDCKDILRLEGCNSYTRIYLDDGGFIMSSYNLSKFDSILPEESFFKVHKSHIISIDKVVMYNSKEACVEMSSGGSVPVSKKTKESFLALFKIAKR